MKRLLEKVLGGLHVVKGPDQRGEYIAWCPFHRDGEGKPPHQPNLYVSERGFICHACGESGGLLEMARRLNVPMDDEAVRYEYRGSDGQAVFRTVRLPGKRFFAEHPVPGGGWQKGLNGTARTLYRLPELISAPPETPVYVVEGEKDADRLAGLGLTATTSPFGAGKWRDEYSDLLQDRDVVILPDNDDPGRKHAETVARSLVGRARSIKIVQLPDLPEKGDVSDWLNAGHTVDELQALATATTIWDGEAAIGKPESTGTATTRAKDLVRMALNQGITLFHDQFGIPHVRVPVQGHHEVWPLESRDFERWFALQYYSGMSKTPAGEGFKAALNVLAGMAIYEGERHELHTRVAEADGKFWYDLADPEWRCVCVDESGWRVVSDAPILFRRLASQSTQVVPTTGGRLEDVLQFVPPSKSCPPELLLPYIATCLIPGIPHPVLIVHGVHGAGKSTGCRALKSLVDPSSLGTLAMAPKFDQLVQQLSHHWYAPYDNVSTLQDWASDALCRAATGEGHSKRALFTDDSDFIYSYKRCIALNCIDVVVQRPDLLDRSIMFEVERLEAKDRLEEKSFWDLFDEAKPKILGACFDAVSRAKGTKPNLKLGALPRMADFAAWGASVAKVTGPGHERFLAAYSEDEQTRIYALLADDPLAAVVVAFVEAKGEWVGPATRLLHQLQRFLPADEIDKHDPRWPAIANRLTTRLKEIQAPLAAVGVNFTTGRDGRGRWLALKWEPKTDAGPSLVTVDDDGQAGTVTTTVTSNQLMENGLRGNDGHDDPPALSIQGEAQGGFSRFGGESH